MYFTHDHLGTFVDPQLELKLGPDIVCRRQCTDVLSPRASKQRVRFRQHFASILEQWDFSRSPAEPLLFFQSWRIRVVINFDAPLAAGRGHESFRGPWQAVKVGMNPEPKVYVGSRSWKFGVTVVEASQEDYIEGILQAVGISTCRPVSQPAFSVPMTSAAKSQPSTQTDITYIARCGAKSSFQRRERCTSATH